MCFVCLVKLENGKHREKNGWFDDLIQKISSLQSLQICWKFLPGQFMQTDANCVEQQFVVETAIMFSRAFDFI